MGKTLSKPIYYFKNTLNNVLNISKRKYLFGYVWERTAEIFRKKVIMESYLKLFWKGIKIQYFEKNTIFNIIQYLEKKILSIYWHMFGKEDLEYFKNKDLAKFRFSLSFLYFTLSLFLCLSHLFLQL